MKYCSNSANCPWGNAIEENICAYSSDDNNECPMIWGKIEYKMDKLIAAVGDD